MFEIRAPLGVGTVCEIPPPFPGKIVVLVPAMVLAGGGRGEHGSPGVVRSTVSLVVWKIIQLVNRPPGIGMIPVVEVEELRRGPPLLQKEMTR